MSAHYLYQSFLNIPNLIMNLHQKRQAGSPAHFHDGGVACPMQLQRHAPPCSEKLDANQVWVDAGVVKFDVRDRETSGVYDICWLERGKGIISCCPVLVDTRFRAADST